MQSTAELQDTNVAVVGLGLMGGSLALALRGKCAALLGVDKDPVVIAQAVERGIVDRGSCQASEILPGAGLIILAAPVGDIETILARLPEVHPGHPVVMDLGSTKREILRAMDKLPARFDPVGGHPMCGTEKTGLDNASPGLYHGAAFALTRLARTSPGGARLAEQAVLAAGARPLWLDAETHDRWTAATSHLPYLVACALANATPAEVGPMVGPGFRSTTRVAGTPDAVMLDILSSNSDNILAALGRFQQELGRLETLLESQDWRLLVLELRRAAGQQERLKGAPG